MELKTLSINNFFSIEEFSHDLSNRGLVLIQGKNQGVDGFTSNGSGKSTIADALCWVFYGKTIRKLGSADDVVNRKKKRNTAVTLEILDDDGTEWKIARYRKHKEYGNSVFLYKNNINVTPKSDKDTVNMISSILHMDLFTFTSSILYSARTFKFTVSTDAEIKQAFDVMLDFNIWKRCHILTKEYLENTDFLLNTNKAQFNEVCNSMERHKEKVFQLSQQRVEHNETKLVKIKQIQGKLKELRLEKSELIRERDKHKKELEVLENEIKKDLQQRVRESQVIENKISGLSRSIFLCEREIESLVRDTKKINIRIDSFSKNVEDTNGLVGSSCPTCGSTVTQKSVDNVTKTAKQEIIELKSELSNLQKEIKNLNKTIISETKEKDKLTKKLVNSADLRDKLDKVNKEIIELNSEVSSSNKIEKSIDSNILECESNLEELNNDENIYDLLILDMKIEFTKYWLKKRRLRKEADVLLKIKEQYNFWLQAFSNQGIKTYLLDSITPFLNERVNYYINKLASNSIDVKFNTQTKLNSGEYREKLNLKVSNANGGEDYLSNSGGERRRVDLAVNMALQDLIASRSNKHINVVFYDEVFDPLDDIGCERVIELLQENISNKSSIFVITHNSTLQSYFDNVLTIVKNKGLSRLEEEN